MKSHLTFQPQNDLFSLISKNGPDWNSKYAVTPNAIEGDPTLFIRAFGPEVAKYFGFSFVDENTLQVPTAKYINSRIDELNPKLSLKNKINLRFYEVMSTEPVLPSEYLARFNKDASIPVCSSGTVAIHDTAFHFGGIFFPNVCLISGILQAELIEAWVSVLIQCGQRTIAERILNEMVLNLDSSLGNFSYGYMEKPERHNSFWILSREGLSATKYFEWVTRAVCSEIGLEAPLAEISEFQKSCGAKHLIDVSVSISDLYRLASEKLQEVISFVK